MKKILISIIIIICFILYALITTEKINNYKEQLSVAESNNKALLTSYDELNNANRVLQLSIEQIEYYNDSITKALQVAINKVKNKDSRIEQLQYMLSTNFRVDTLSLIDTIFVKDYHLDTLIKDQWYSLNLNLDYPNKIVVSPKFINEFTTVFSSKKETIYPPKKCFLLRWFQKKHTVVEVSVFNNNPYSTIDTTRFVKTIK